MALQTSSFSADLLDRQRLPPLHEIFRGDLLQRTPMIPNDAPQPRMQRSVDALRSGDGTNTMVTSEEAATRRADPTTGNFTQTLAHRKTLGDLKSAANLSRHMPYETMKSAIPSDFAPLGVKSPGALVEPASTSVYEKQPQSAHELETPQGGFQKGFLFGPVTYRSSNSAALQEQASARPSYIDYRRGSAPANSQAFSNFEWPRQHRRSLSPKLGEKHRSTSRVSKPAINIKNAHNQAEMARRQSHRISINNFRKLVPRCAADSSKDTTLKESVAYIQSFQELLPAIARLVADIDGPDAAAVRHFLETQHGHDNVLTPPSSGRSTPRYDQRSMPANPLNQEFLHLESFHKG
ncbi:hypothetical protein L228DRAFT_266133 [Xylona heveae TC161]|uniref:BHLH domain-containing protein n=1 Tax=Xylona heveae (strain CBS 132557 / TC161) TaxID=1328760 RepID=A0A165J3B4_XYLHT|nr:hypothetical protein L228DRAFT_266133 [Xylona heveae TC161]KZF25674.1 hypothetical protein L228DRAFT_266133 [Xylona heveae TC161]